nr:DoxX family membrane protein [Domibacillus aminovorans]
MVAYVFITSGLMKLLNAELGHHLMSLGPPFSQNTIYIIAIIEIICGIFILVNRGVKLATIPLIIIMVAALLLTKVSSLQSGFIQFAFNARLDIVMLVLLYILHSMGIRR